MPFAAHPSLVSGGAKIVRKDPVIQRQPRVVVHAGARCELTGEERGACQAADRVDVKALEPHTTGGQPVEMGRPDGRTMESDVTPTHIVGHDGDDVRARRGRPFGRRCEQTKKHRGKDSFQDAPHDKLYNTADPTKLRRKTLVRPAPEKVSPTDQPISANTAPPRRRAPS